MAEGDELGRVTERSYSRILLRLRRQFEIGAAGHQDAVALAWDAAFVYC